MEVEVKYQINRIMNCGNEHQGEYRRVLCVCSAGLLRSPTAALVLSKEPFNFNTRCAGIVPEYALVPVDPVLIEWASEIVCMEDWQEEALKKLTKKPVKCLHIQDSYAYRDPDLMWLIAEKYKSVSEPTTPSIGVEGVSEMQCAKASEEKWYHWHRFALLPHIRTRQADRFNTWSFHFHWLCFRAWSSDAPMLGFSVGLNDMSFNVRLDLPYLWTMISIPLFPMNYSMRFWRRPPTPTPEAAE